MAEVRRAYVLDGMVQAVYQDDEAVIAEKLAPIAEHLIDCPPEVQANWLRIGDAFVDPVTLLPPPSVRQLRRAAYFDALRVEGGDDQVTVLGDQVDKILQQLAVIVPVGSRTPEFSDLISKVLAVKARLPKAG